MSRLHRLSSDRDAARHSREERREGQLRGKLAALKVVVELLPCRD